MSDYKDKVTKGPWHVLDSGPHWNNTAIPNYRVIRTPAPSGPNGYDVAWSASGELVVEHVYEEPDAQLIAEAGTVLHETGLTPRELVEQRDRLLAALREAYNAFAHDDEGPVWADSTIAKARAAIAACEAAP